MTVHVSIKEEQQVLRLDPNLSVFVGVEVVYTRACGHLFQVISALWENMLIPHRWRLLQYQELWKPVCGVFRS